MIFEGETLRVPDVAPPVENPWPEQLVVFADVQVRVALCPFKIDEGFAESDAVGVGSETATVLLHDEVLLTPPEVTVTLPDLVPVVVYVFCTVRVVPLRLFVPLHTYVYVPVPPVGVAVQVTDWPVVAEVGDGVQET